MCSSRAISLLVDYALAGDRLIGIVQPAPDAGESNRRPARASPCGAWAAPGGSPPSPRATTAALMLSLTGIARFRHVAGRRVRRAVPLLPGRLRRVRHRFHVAATARRTSTGRACSPRSRNYLIANNLNADWDRINSASNERLVNTLSILSPYGPEEKQALLEAPRFARRAPRRWWRSPRWSLRHATTAREHRCNDRHRRATMTNRPDHAAAHAASIRSCSRFWSVP